MIYKLRDKRATKDLVKLLKANNKFISLSGSSAAEYIAEGIGNSNALILVDEAEGSIFGFIYATIEEWNGEDVCFIQNCVISQERAKLGVSELFLGKVNDWCDAKGISKMLFSCGIDGDGKTRADIFERKYKFEKVAFILAKQVD